jgi:hypothetical protein
MGGGSTTRAPARSNHPDQAVSTHPLPALGCYIFKSALPYRMYPSVEHHAKEHQVTVGANRLSAVACPANLRHIPSKPSSGVLEQCYPASLDCRAPFQPRLRTYDHNRHYSKDRSGDRMGCLLANPGSGACLGLPTDSSQSKIGYTALASGWMIGL